MTPSGSFLHSQAIWSKRAGRRAVASWSLGGGEAGDGAGDEAGEEPALEGEGLTRPWGQPRGGLDVAGEAVAVFG